MKEEKISIEDKLKELREKYGSGVIMYGDSAPEKVEFIPTGCYALDRVLGCGGLPRGRIIELYGEPSSGKTATTLFLIAQIQKGGGRCAFIDSEHSFNADWASTIGVNVKELFFSQPTTLEEGMDILRTLVNTGDFDLVVIDSVAGLTPKAEVEGKDMLAEQQMAMKAKLMAKALRIMTGEVSRSKTIVIFINHLQEKIGKFWGESTTTPGGKMLKFVASIRLSASKGLKIEGPNETQIGNLVTVRATKNKVAPPYGSGTYYLYYKTGVDLSADVFDEGVFRGIIEKTGNTYSYGDKKLGVGRDASLKTLKTSEITDEIREKLKHEYDKK